MSGEVSEIKYILKNTFESPLYRIQPIKQREENFNIHKLTLISISVLWQRTSEPARVKPYKMLQRKLIMYGVLK